MDWRLCGHSPALPRLQALHQATQLGALVGQVLVVGTDAGTSQHQAAGHQVERAVVVLILMLLRLRF
ncbi:MAG: hypothetical protein WBM74_08395 [Polyangiales bacterium]